VEHRGLAADVSLTSSSCYLERYDNAVGSVRVTLGVGYAIRYFMRGEEVGKHHAAILPSPPFRVTQQWVINIFAELR
jgi:hypothetical protein